MTEIAEDPASADGASRCLDASNARCTIDGDPVVLKLRALRDGAQRNADEAKQTADEAQSVLDLYLETKMALPEWHVALKVANIFWGDLEEDTALRRARAGPAVKIFGKWFVPVSRLVFSTKLGSAVAARLLAAAERACEPIERDELRALAKNVSRGVDCGMFPVTGRPGIEQSSSKGAPT
jgi:hypothetical protein